MAEQRKKPNPHDTAGKDPFATEPFLNLEIPRDKSKPQPLDEPIEVAEVVEEEIPVVEADDALAGVDAVDEIVDVIEEADLEPAAPSTDVSKLELVEDVAEVTEEDIDIDALLADKPPAPKAKAAAPAAKALPKSQPKAAEPSDDDIFEVLEAAASGSNVAEAALVEDAEVAEAASSSKVLEAPLVEDLEEVEVVEDVEELEVAEAAPSSKTLAAALVEDDEVAEVVEVAGSSSSVLEAPLVEDDEVAEVVEVAGSSSSVLEAPLVEADEDIDIVEAVGSSSSIIEAPLVDDDVEVAEVAPSSQALEAPLVEDEDVFATQAWADTKEAPPGADKAPAAGAKKPSAKEPSSAVEIDGLLEAMDSGIDFNTVKPDSPSGAKHAGRESDIDIDSILSENDESSAVDLGGSGEKPALPKSPVPSSKINALMSEAELLTGEESGEPAEVVGEDALLADSVTEYEDDDAVLVKPKKKAIIEKDVELTAAAALAADDEPMVSAAAEDDDAVVSVAAEDDDEKPASGKKPPKRELVGAGGGKRGGFMPFLFGGLLGTVLLGGGGAAAWYFNALPQSPNANAVKKFVAPPPQNVAQTDAQKARDLIDRGQVDQAYDLVKDAKDGPEVGMLGLVLYKKHEAKLMGDKQAIHADDQVVADALKKMDEGDAKAAADDIRGRLKHTDALLAAAPKNDGGDLKQLQDDLQKVLQDKDKTVGQLKVTEKALMEAQAQNNQLNAALQAGGGQGKELEKVLAEAKLPVEGEKLKAVVADLMKSWDSSVAIIDVLVKAKAIEAADAHPVQKEALVKALGDLILAKAAADGKLADLNDTLAKAGIKEGDVNAIQTLGAARDALNKDLNTLKSAIEGLTKAESPERRLDAILMVTYDRGFTDAKELQSFQKYIDWVRSNESKASPEARAKALFAAALVQRNQGNAGGARQALDQAVKEAQALPGALSLQASVAQGLKEIADPAAYYLPRVDRKIADGQRKEALDEINAALKALPGQPQLLLKRAQLTFDTAQRQGKLDAATQQRIRADGEAARKDATLAAESFYLLGRLEEQNGDWVKAETNFRAAAELAAADQKDRYRAALGRVLIQRDTPGGSDPEPDFSDDELPMSEVAFVDEEPPQDTSGQQRLEESIRIAEELIRKDDLRTQGEGYMLLGSAQARLGKTTDGLKNYLKGLKLAHPDWSTAELERIIANHPAFNQPDAAAAEPNPLMADRHFSRGLDYFWAKKYTEAEKEFATAVAFYDADARYRYFLGMSRYVQGTAQKRRLADFDFEKGLQLELARHPSSRDINASLERIQGDLRKVLNNYRDRPLVGG